METVDALSRILRSLRLESGLISRGRFTAPWAVHTGGLERGAVFHAVVSGTCVAKRDADLQGVTLGPGELVCFTRGDAHTVSDGSGVRPAEIRDLPVTREAGLAVVSHGGGGQSSRVLCGRFDLDHAAATLEDLLPPVIVIRRRQSGVVEWLSSTLGLITHELDTYRQGSEEILTRLTDILFVQVLRTHALSLSPGEGGWLGAAHDPRIAQALALIHEDPGAAWTAADLGRKVGLSRSAFFARFTELVGETPTRYLTRWRMKQAMELLRDEGLALIEIAEQVGYSSEDAFSRAFKRVLGQTPASWRREHRPGPG